MHSLIENREKNPEDKKDKKKAEINNLYDLISDETTIADCEGKSYSIKDFIFSTRDKIFYKFPDNKDIP